MDDRFTLQTTIDAAELNIGHSKQRIADLERDIGNEEKAGRPAKALRIRLEAEKRSLAQSEATRAQYVKRLEALPKKN
jgi:hypothetical protein